MADAVPHGHGCTTTSVCSLTTNGLVAPHVLFWPMTGPAPLRRHAAACCAGLGEGNVVVTDNLPAHKVAGVREAMGAAGGTVMDLAPTLPDLNSLERTFGKHKASPEAPRPHS